MLDIGYTDLNFPNHKKHPNINKNGLIRINKEINKK
jgi:hypothetical protein